MDRWASINFSWYSQSHDSQLANIYYLYAIVSYSSDHRTSPSLGVMVSLYFFSFCAPNPSVCRSESESEVQSIHSWSKPWRCWQYMTRDWIRNPADALAHLHYTEFRLQIYKVEKLSWTFDCAPHLFSSLWYVKSLVLGDHGRCQRCFEQAHCEQHLWPQRCCRCCYWWWNGWYKKLLKSFTHTSKLLRVSDSW